MKRKQTGLMLLRVWTEEGSTEPLRVDVRQTFNLSRGFHRTLTLTDIDRVLAAVRKFLEAGRVVGAPGGNDVRAQQATRSVRGNDQPSSPRNPS